MFFTESFIDFDEGYSYSQFYPFYQAELSDGYTRLELNAVTETYRYDSKQFADNVIAFYKSLPYDGYIIDREVTGLDSNDPNIHATIYLSNKNNSFLPHLSFSSNTLNVDFNNESEQYTITNDLSDTNALEYIVPFNKFRSEVRSDFMKEKVVYKPLHGFDISKLKSNNSIILMSFIVPTSEISSFKALLEEQFILPNYNCRESEFPDPNRICNMGLFESEAPTYVENKMSFNVLSNPFEFPKPILFLTAFSLFLSMLQLSFKESKEISIRRLYGNNEGVIYLRVFAKTIAESLLVFFPTLIVLAVFVLNFNLSITARYISVLFSIAFVYFVGIIVTALVFYGVLKEASKVHALKKTINPIVVLYISLAIKVLAILVLIVPLISSYENMTTSKLYMKHYEQYPHLKEGYVTDYINYGYEMDVVKQTQTNVWLFNLVEKYGFDYIDDGQLISFNYGVSDEGVFSYISVNRNALKHNDIYGLDNRLIQIQSLSKNTLLVPERYQRSYDKSTFTGEADVIVVKETPDFSGSVVGRNPLKSPPVLIVVDNPSYYVGGINSMSIRIPDDSSSMTAFYHEVTQQLSAPKLTRNQDFYEMAKGNYQNKLSECVLLTVSSLLVISMFSIMMVISFIESNRKLLAIQYVHGVPRWRRYEVLIYMMIISIALVGIIVYIKNALANPLLGNVMQMNAILIFSSVVLIVDLLLLMISITRFESDSISSILKGDA